MRDEPDADAMPAASPRRQVGQGAVVFTVRLRDNRSAAAEVKIGIPRVAVWPAADPWGERENFFGGSQDGGERCARRRFRRHRFRINCRRGDTGLGFGIGDRGLGVRRSASVRLGRSGSLLDVPDRDFLGSQEAEHNADAAGDAAIAMLPASDAPRTDTEQLGGAMLREAERAERRAQFGRGR